MSTHPRAEFRRADFFALLLVALFAVLNFARCLFVDNSVVFQDEYMYKVLSDRLVSQDVVLGRGLAPQVPNRLYLFVYGAVSDFGANTYVGARFLNVLFWVLGLWVLYRLARLTGLSDGRSLAFLGAAALLPLSSYAQYFMPESMFFAFFCVAAYALLSGVLRNIATQVVAAGAVMGSMYFIKPHAAPLIVATAFYLLLLPRRLALVVRFALGVIISFSIGKLLTAAPTGGGSSLGLYRLMLGNMWATLTSQPALGRDLLTVAAGHGMFLFGVMGLSVILSVAVAVPALRLREAGRPVSVELERLALFVVISGFVLVSMSIIFTALVGETGRVHSRYYFFLYPLALLTLFHLPSARFSMAAKILGTLLVLTVPALMAYFAPGYAVMLYMSLVPDGPEWGFAFFSQAWFFGLLGGLALTAAWSLWQPGRVMVFVAMLGLASVVSSLYVTQSQKTDFHGPYTTEREAVTVETFLGREAMNTALVLGVNWDVITKFLFFLTTTPFAIIMPAGSDLGPLIADKPEMTTVISLSDSYVLPPELRCTLQFQGVKVCLR